MGGVRLFGDKFGKDAASIIIEKIRGGDEQLRAQFIEEHKLFILKTVANVLRKSTIPKNSEEFSTGLAAFNYAIDHFASKSELSFLIYCEQVIRESLTAYNPGNQQNQSIVYPVESGDKIFNLDSTETNEEINLFKQKLWGWGITLKDLAMTSPKHRHSIQQSLKIAKVLAGSQEFYNKLCSTKRIPTDEILKVVKGHEGTIEKNKKHIIALCLILNSGLSVMKWYLKNTERGLNSSDSTGIVLELSKKESVIMTAQGSFMVIRSRYNMHIGHQVTFSKSNILRFKGNILRYAAVTAVIMIVFIGIFSAYWFLQGLTGIDFNILADKIGLSAKQWSQDNKETGTDNKLNESVKESEKDSLNNTVTPKKTVGKKSDVAKVTDVKPSNKEKISTPAPKASAKSTKSSVGNLTLVSPTFNKAQSTAILAQSTERKPGSQPIPTGYPTVKATGVPGLPRLSADMYEVNVGDDYTISMIMGKGNNGTVWILYENDKPVATRHYSDNSPNEQIGMRLFSAKQPGKYTYRCELTNGFGSTGSEEITVVVK